MSAQDHLSPKQFSDRTGLSLKTVYRRLHDGTLPRVQLGGRHHRILIPVVALALLTPGKATSTTVEPSAVKPAPKPGRKPDWLKDLHP
jgi:excisionase family DNA binding protein